MTGSDISISAKKDTTALKVSLCASHTSEIKGPDLSQSNTSNTAKHGNSVIIYTLIKINNA